MRAGCPRAKEAQGDGNATIWGNSKHKFGTLRPPVIAGPGGAWAIVSALA